MDFGRWYSDDVQTELTSLLKTTGVKVPDNLWWYRPQEFVDDEDWHFPWAVPGGLAVQGRKPITGWNSWTAATVIGKGWQTGEPYAAGQRFVEMLLNSQSGKPFTVRNAAKDSRWHRSVTFEDAKEFPRGYVPVGSCIECHDRKSAPRAKDTVISFLR